MTAVAAGTTPLRRLACENESGRICAVQAVCGVWSIGVLVPIDDEEEGEEVSKLGAFVPSPRNSRTQVFSAVFLGVAGDSYRLLIRLYMTFCCWDSLRRLTMVFPESRINNDLDMGASLLQPSP